MDDGCVRCYEPMIQWRVRFFLFGSFSFFASGLIVAYILWLSQGCVATPFLSDFLGGYSQVAFPVLMSIGAVLMIPTWIDWKDAQKENSIVAVCLLLCPCFTFCCKRFLPEPETCCRGCMRIFVAVWGIICNCILLGWVNNPGQSSVQLAICSLGLYLGWLLLGTFLLVVQSHFPRYRGCSLWTGVVFFSIASLCLIARFVVMYFGLMELHDRRGDGATHIWREVLLPGFDLESNQLMREDFPAYCRGEQGTLHSIPLLNVAAVLECFYLISIFVTVFTVLIRTLVKWPDFAADLEADINRASETSLQNAA